MDLNIRIQDGIHSSIIDARVSLALFLHNGKLTDYLDFMTEERLHGSRQESHLVKYNKAKRQQLLSHEDKENFTENRVRAFSSSLEIEDDQFYMVNLSEVKELIQLRVKEFFN